MAEISEHIIQFFMMESGIRAVLASVLVGGLCGVLGCFIVLRNMSLIGDALSHAILPGIVLAFILFGYSTAAFFGGSVLVGLLSAILITWLQQKVRVKNDAAIGIIFTFMFSTGVIGISWLSHNEGVHIDLKDFLFGNILAVSVEDVILTSGMALLVLIVILLSYRALFTTTFQSVIAETLGFKPASIHYLLMLLLSLSVVASLRSVGVILVVAMLITPASAALLISDRLSRVLATAGIIGMLAAMTGILLSISFDFPPGPSMAIVTTAFYMIIVMIAPKRGLIPKWFRKRQMEKRVIIEDILKQSFKSGANHGLTFEELSSKIGHSPSKIKKWFYTLTKLGLMEPSKTEIKLSAEGMKRANQLVRAHRLWETFLVDQLGLNIDQIHEEAERFEHHLSEEDINEVDEKLGFPETDPHGSPIPKI
ncbi:MAG: metal ABC transporter permease [Bacteroidota bacterium]|nr:metal ABC transporter permease [Bacteroidota bacterium]